MIKFMVIFFCNMELSTLVYGFVKVLTCVCKKLFYVYLALCQKKQTEVCLTKVESARFLNSLDWVCLWKFVFEQMVMILLFVFSKCFQTSSTHLIFVMCSFAVGLQAWDERRHPRNG